MHTQDKTDALSYTIQNFIHTLGCHTLTSWVKWVLSSGGLPLLAGYSQSMSRPSKPCFCRNWTDVVAKSLRPASVATIRVKGADPIFHPPTANNVFREGFRCLRLLKRSYLRRHWNQNKTLIRTEKVKNYPKKFGDFNSLWNATYWLNLPSSISVYLLF